MLQLLYLDPHLLDPDPDGVREDPGDIEGLARTIAEQGLLQPLGVVDIGHGRYQVVYGNRRRAAALHLGLEKVPCILLRADDPGLLLRQIVENIQREDLNDMEKARAFARLRAHIAATRQITSANDLDEATGSEMGLSGRSVRRYLGLLDLPDEVQQLIRSGELSVTQAQHLRRIPNQRTLLELAREAAAEGMSAAELSRLAAYFAANPNQTLETALQALLQGERVHERPAPEISIAGGPLAKGGAAGPDDSNDDFWDDDDSADQDGGGFLSVDEDDTIENQPANKARVFRLRSLDQMVDETDRLSRAYVEGDLQKWVQQDENAPFKLRLLLKQLDTLSSGLRDLARQRGWE